MRKLIEDKNIVVLKVWKAFIYSRKKKILKQKFISVLPYRTEYRVIKYGNAMKFYESMAMDLPVVSVPIGLLMQYQNQWVRFAGDQESFVREMKGIVEKRKNRGNIRVAENSSPKKLEIQNK